uniref:hypothetical protein n=1 Tax=Lewinella cohaerens TaxID=70995 RepID=UPI000476519A
VVDGAESDPNDPCDPDPNAVPGACGTVLNVKVLLQGALIGTSDGLMRDDLRTQNRIPLLEPYTATGAARFTHFGNGGGETTTVGVLNTGAGTADAIVDWVFLEIRDAADSTVILETLSALVQRDGDVVDAVTGVAPEILGLPTSFYVSVKHRNHLGVMTAAPLTVDVNLEVLIDFTSAADADVYNTTGYDGVEMAGSVGEKSLWAGNANLDGKVKYDGGFNDRQTIFAQVITFPGNTDDELNYNNAFGYFSGDINMDGKVKYDGGGNDRVIIQGIVQILYPLNTDDSLNYDNLLEQLPQ